MKTERTDYQRIADLIQHLGEHFRDQPSLDEIAEIAGLDRYQTERLFARWVGVPPARFVRFLTHADARERLRSSTSVLDATFETGLSSPGRLHDLFVSVEAMTPGQSKRRGAGLEISWGAHDSVLGLVLLGVTERGVCWLSFPTDVDNGVADIADRWPAASIRHEPAATVDLAAQLEGALRDREPGRWRLHLDGTNFQLQVWRALLSIPSGAVTTYGDLAARIGRPTSARAVGTAVGQNPVSVLIPCHRVLHRAIAPTRYRWGPTRKRALLAREWAVSPSVR